MGRSACSGGQTGDCEKCEKSYVSSACGRKWIHQRQRSFLSRPHALLTANSSHSCDTFVVKGEGGGGTNRLLTANFLHDSFLHLAASCYALWTLAPEVEKVLGYRIFTAVYILTGLAGSTACFMYTDTITVGASSGLFGLIGALPAQASREQPFCPPCGP